MFSVKSRKKNNIDNIEEELKKFEIKEEEPEPEEEEPEEKKVRKNNYLFILKTFTALVSETWTRILKEATRLTYLFLQICNLINLFSGVRG